MKRLLFIFLTLICLGCDDVKLPESSVQLVLEGWVEDNGRPVVIVTTAVPVQTEFKDLSDLQNHIVRWGKVTISDGETETILSGRKDDDYFPPFVYTKDTYRIEAGKTYTVDVNYSGRHAMASVNVPPRKPLEYIRVEQVQGKENAYRLVSGVKDDSPQTDRYKFFVKREGKDSTYVSSFLGYVSEDSFVSDLEEVAIYNGISVLSETFEQYFTADDVVYVKFCVLDQQTWQYWNDYEELTSLSRNPFFPVSSKIRSNVNGGLGYFSGYGASYYKVSIPDSLAQGVCRTQNNL